jgi:hypothetical protein
MINRARVRACSQLADRKRESARMFERAVELRLILSTRATVLRFPDFVTSEPVPRYSLPSFSSNGQSRARRESRLNACLFEGREEIPSVFEEYLRRNE